MFRLAHISDVHLGPLPPVRTRELISKRITGYINWQRNRKHRLADGVMPRVIEGMLASGADHVAITGDLINLGLDAEFAHARDWLKELGDPRHISVVPGNHDAYVPGALAKAKRQWSPWMTGDSGPPERESARFPYLRVRDDVAVIGCSSAVATAPFLATGSFSAAQARRLDAILRQCGEDGLFRVVLIHHPPVRHSTAPHKRLNGGSLFRKTVLAAGAELVLHGHTHLASLLEIADDRTSIPVVGVPATGQPADGRHDAGGYNLFEIGRTNSGWNVGLTRYAVNGPTGVPVPSGSMKL